MCIMEVRPGQRSSTIAQACAHNLSTVDRDLDMFRPLLAARGETELLALVNDAAEHMHAAYAQLLAVFVDEITTEVRVHGDHDHGDHNHGTEREATDNYSGAEIRAHWHGDDTLEARVRGIARDVAERDAHAARRFETR